MMKAMRCGFRITALRPGVAAEDFICTLLYHILTLYNNGGILLHYRIIIYEIVMGSNGNRILLYYGNESLRTVAGDIPQVTREIRELAEEMFSIMHIEQGIGLAATQIGVPLRILTIDIRSNKGPMLALINPKIRAYSDYKEGYEEGCLSLPGILEDIIRPVSIQVEGISINEKPVTFEASGLLARVLQHEIDHLNGKLFIDYLEEYKRKELTAQLKKIKKLNRQ